MIESLKALLIIAVLGSMSACGGDGSEAHEDHDGATSAAHEGESAESGHADHADEPAEQAAIGTVAGEVELSPAQRDKLNLVVEEVAAGSASDTVSAPATATFDRDRIARVGPRLDAKVIRVIADLGDRVQAGDPLAELDSVALGKAKARHLTTLARLETVRASYEREVTLNEQDITSDAELEEARARLAEARAEHDAADEELRLYGLTPEEIDSVEADAEQPLSRYVLTSPLDGVVQHRDLVPGQTVGANETPILVVDTSRLWVMIEASETQAGSLSEGQNVALDVRSLPDARPTGTIDWVSASLDGASRTIRARARVDNPQGRLKDGMFATARIRATGSASHALVPLDAVQELHGKSIVFVPGDEEGHFRAIRVRPGTESDSAVEILDGIEPGDRVVASGAFDLKSALTASSRSAAHSH